MIDHLIESIKQSTLTVLENKRRQQIKNDIFEQNLGVIKDACKFIKNKLGECTDFEDSLIELRDKAEKHAETVTQLTCDFLHEVQNEVEKAVLRNPRQSKEENFKELNEIINIISEEFNKQEVKIDA